MKISESIALCHAATGTPIKQIESDIKKRLWPDSSYISAHQNFKRLIANDNIDSIIKVICDEAGTTPNFLFGIE